MDLAQVALVLSGVAAVMGGYSGYVTASNNRRQTTVQSDQVRMEQAWDIYQNVLSEYKAENNDLKARATEADKRANNQEAAIIRLQDQLRECEEKHHKTELELVQVKAEMRRDGPTPPDETP